jgi:endonuclease YncB( thermonuclease family)
MFAAATLFAVSGSGSATVSYVVDGDTLALRDGARVRLVQIDTPEVGTGECYSRRAARDLRKLVPAGARIGLRSDPRLDSVDRYGRQLRYVFHRGVNVNLRLVEQGDATVWLYGGDRGRYAEKLLAAARRARAAKRGLWGACKTVWNPYGPATTRPAHARSRNPGRPGHRCDPSYSTVCIPPAPPDLDCADVLPHRHFKVVGRDPHHFDGDRDGIGCE